MKIKKYSNFWLVFGGFFLVVLVFLLTKENVWAQNFRDVNLMVPIPDQPDAAGGKTVSSGGAGYLLTYISAIVTWVSSILGMICVGIFIFSGFQIMANFGNTAIVDQAKERILNVVFGLILLLTMALLLHTINPGFFRWDAKPGAEPGTGREETYDEQIVVAAEATDSNSNIACQTAFHNAQKEIPAREAEIVARVGASKAECNRVDIDCRYITNTRAKACTATCSLNCKVTVIR